MMTMGEIKHAAAVESCLRRIVRTLESINRKLPAKVAPSGGGVAKAEDTNNNN